MDTGESAQETVKTIVQGMPDRFDVPVVTTLVWFSHFHARLRVQSAPGIPCALFLRGMLFLQKLGRDAPREGGLVPLPLSSCPASCRASTFFAHQTWVAGTSPAMTIFTMAKTSAGERSSHGRALALRASRGGGG